MAASPSQLFFLVSLFFGGCVVYRPCEAHPGCTLGNVQVCTSTLMSLPDLRPVLWCPRTELTCLEKLESCAAIDNIINVFRYLCDDQTGGSDLRAVQACFADEVKHYNSTQDVDAVCLPQSGWVDTLRGQPRCSAATTYATCLRASAGRYCNSPQEGRFFDKTVHLMKSYGCFPVGKGNIGIPNLGMVTVTLALTLVTMLFKW